jgi:hypothetical protein
MRVSLHVRKAGFGWHSNRLGRPTSLVPAGKQHALHRPMQGSISNLESAKFQWVPAHFPTTSFDNSTRQTRRQQSGQQQTAAMNRVALRSARLAPALRQPGLLGRPLALALGARPLSTVAEVSFWRSLVPKPLRTWREQRGKPKVQKEWNPATFFIFTFLLIGSMAIQMIALKKDFATFMRQSDVRIGLLREVVEKLQKGEEVDVEKVLGTGDAEKEVAWEEGSQPF